MKKLILVVTIVVSCILACKKKEEAPAPIEKKYEYKRTSGEVTKIEGDIFVDTGGTVFTVKGKGFDPSKRRFYHLLLGSTCSLNGRMPRTMDLNGFKSYLYADTAKIVHITDTTIYFLVAGKDIYNARETVTGGTGCIFVDSIEVTFAVTSIDFTDPNNSLTKFDPLKKTKTKNKLFFNIIKDTLIWHTKSSYQVTEIALTLNDVVPSGGYGDQVLLYLNDKLLNTTNQSVHSGMPFPKASLFNGDSYFLFGKDFYNDNISLGLTNGEYTITMKEKKTGLPIEERTNKKKVYVKFVD